MSTPGDIGLRRYSPDYEKDDLEAENRRLIEAMATALQHLEKGRALWNGPCHQCAYVLRDALGMGEQRALTTEHEKTAIAAERETCAKIAENAGPATQDMHSTELSEFADRIAAAIRARITP